MAASLRQEDFAAPFPIDAGRLLVPAPAALPPRGADPRAACAGGTSSARPISMPTRSWARFPLRHRRDRKDHVAVEGFARHLGPGSTGKRRAHRPRRAHHRPARRRLCRRQGRGSPAAGGGRGIWAAPLPAHSLSGADQLGDIDLLAPAMTLGAGLDFFGVAPVPIPYAALKARMAEATPAPSH